MTKKETQEQEQEAEASMEEEVTPPDKGEMLLTKRVLCGFQRLEEEGEDPEDEGETLKLKPLLSNQKYTSNPPKETQPSSPPTDPAKNVSYGSNMVALRTHLNNRHLLNFRTNSFQQGEDDGDPPWGHS